MINHIAYLMFCIFAAYCLYKPRQKRLFLRASAGYAVFMSGWFILFSAMLIVPSLDLLPIWWSVFPLFFFYSLVWLLSPYIVRLWGSAPPKKLSEKPATLLIRFEPRIFLTKYFEIIFQQSVFVYLLAVILAGQPLLDKLGWFVTIIALIHLGNLPFTGRRDTMFYFYLSIPMAILFGWLIVNGYVFVAASIHITFYLLFNGRHWFTVAYER